MESHIPHLTPFDSLVSDTFLQTVKIFIPYLPPNMQYVIGIYVKMSELTYIMSNRQFTIQKSLNASSFLSEIEPYLPDESKKIFSEFQEYVEMFEMMQGMDFSEMDFTNIFQSERSASHE